MWSQIHADRYLLSKVVMASKVQVTANFTQAIADASVPLYVPGVKRSRMDLGAFTNDLIENSVTSKLARCDEAVGAAGGVGSSSSTGPMQNVRSLTTSVGEGTLSSLDMKATLIERMKGLTL